MMSQKNRQTQRSAPSSPLFGAANGYNRIRRGVTLIEMLVASLIMLVSIVGFVSVWAQMMRTTLVSDNRGSAYEVAKQVMERTHGVGFYSILPTITTFPVNAQNDPSYHRSLLSRWRFFDEGMKEIEAYDPITTQNLANGTINTARPASPQQNARFCVLTEIAFTPDANRVAGRPDLQMLAIQVTVYDARVANGPVLYQMQDALTTGGV